MQALSLLQAGCDARARTHANATALMEFMFTGNVEAALVLIEAGAYDDMNSFLPLDEEEQEEQAQHTLLHLEAGRGLLTIAKVLLAAGAHINEPDVYVA